MGKRTALRQAKEAAKEQAIVNSLQKYTKEIKEKKKQLGPKRKEATELLTYIEYDDIKDYAIRDINKYKVSSYNLGKQIVNLVNHLFVKYYVPRFMYKAVVKDLRQLQQTRLHLHRAARKFEFMYDIYREWFISIAQGKSFQKAVRGIMTKKEVVIFLSIREDVEIHEAIWLAKALAIGIPRETANILISKVLESYFPDDPDGRLNELLYFIANNQAALRRIGMDINELMDFINYIVANESKFRFKGRTVQSMIHLSNEWHLGLRAVDEAAIKSAAAWYGLRFTTFVHETQQNIWEVIELRTSKALVVEGQKQHHCVGSYSYYCSSGRSSIFSMRRYNKYKVGPDVPYVKGKEISRVTIEVRLPDREIVQARGPANRSMTEEERKTFREWVGKYGLRVSTYVR